LLIFFVEEKMDILDQTETNLVALRRTVYLTIQSRYFLHSFSLLKQMLFTGDFIFVL
jgi:hypothetical protein